MLKALVIIKPGFLKYTSDILKAYKELGYDVVDKFNAILNKKQCDIIWADYKMTCINHNKIDAFNKYCEYVMSDVVTCAVLFNENGVYNDVINTKFKLRQKYGVSGYMNLLHVSDSNDDAEKEIFCIKQM